MKNHFISLFGTELKRTIIFFMTGVVLLSVALIVGITDNLPMIAMMLSGIIFFYFALLHPWKKASGFAILMGICLLIITIDFINPFINEGIAMSVGFVCFAGMITGIIGIFSRIKGWHKLPYSASLLSLVTLGMMITSIPNPGQINNWIIYSLQMLITILLFILGISNNAENSLTRLLLIVVAIVLILLAILEVYASGFEYQVNSQEFTRYAFRIVAGTEIIISGL